MSHFKKENFTPSTRETVEEILRYPIKELVDRKISKATCERFGVRVALSEKDGKSVEAIYFPYKIDGKVKGFKKKDLTKPKSERGHFTYIGTVDISCELFGQDVGPTGGKKITITEGELDQLATYEMLKSKYPKGEPKVVSIGMGAPNAAQHIGNNLEVLKGFQDVVIAFDNDKATPEERKRGVKRGKEAIEDVVQLLPNVLVAKYSSKDPNQCKLDGKEEEFYWSIIKAASYQPEGLITVEDAYDEAILMPQWGRKWPWPSLDKLTFGRRDGEGIYIGAAVKGGKTEWLSQMVDHIIHEEKSKVGLFKFEQTPGVTLKALAGKRNHKQFHNPQHADEKRFTQLELSEAVNSLKGKVFMFDASFSDVGKYNMWDRMKPALRYMVLVEGIRDIFIDPITQLTDGLSPSDTETELRRFSNELQGMAQDLGFFYYCFAHLKEPSQGKTHEEGGKIKVAQFRGSRAMAEKTKLMLGIGRDQYAEDIEVRNTSKFCLLLNSGFGKTGTFDVYYNSETGDYLEPQRENF